MNRTIKYLVLTLALAMFAAPVTPVFADDTDTNAAAQQAYEDAKAAADAQAQIQAAQAQIAAMQAAIEAQEAAAKAAMQNMGN